MKHASDVLFPKKVNHADGLHMQYMVQIYPIGRYYIHNQMEFLLIWRLIKVMLFVELPSSFFLLNWSWISWISTFHKKIGSLMSYRFCPAPSLGASGAVCGLVNNSVYVSCCYFWLFHFLYPQNFACYIFKTRKSSKLEENLVISWTLRFSSFLEWC